jgi:hypothetical protein
MRTAIIIFILALTGSAIAGDLPDPKKTPGDINSALTKQVLCAKGQEKHKVYTSYRMNPKKKPCSCEVDHLISLELGGSNDLKNLWPQSYQTKPWNAHVKDRLENALHKLVCAGSISLKQAQHEISTNWIDSYKTHCKGNACPAWKPPK